MILVGLSTFWGLKRGGLLYSEDAFCAGGDADRVVDAEAGDGKDVVRVLGAAEEFDEGFFVRRDVVVCEPVLEFLFAGSAKGLDPVTGFPAAENQLSVNLVRIHNKFTFRLFNLLSPIPHLFFNLEV